MSDMDEEPPVYDFLVFETLIKELKHPIIVPVLGIGQPKYRCLSCKMEGTWYTSQSRGIGDLFTVKCYVDQDLNLDL